MVSVPVALPTPGARAKRLKALTFQVNPYDITLHGEEADLYAIQARKSNWLKSQTEACRLISIHAPATLRPVIEETIETARNSCDPWRTARLMGYRQHYEELDRNGNFQTARSNLIVWTEEGSPNSIEATATGAFNTRVLEAPLTPLLRGRYEIRISPFWHLAPVGKPANRPYMLFLTSYEFSPVEWTFFRPLGLLFSLNFPIAVAVDVPKTWESPDAVARIEGMINAYTTHLVTAKGEDSAAFKRITDCRAALKDIHDGQSLHELQLIIGLSAYDLDSLKAHRDEVITQLKPFVRLRHEVGHGQVKASWFFSTKTTKTIGIDSTWPMASDAAALTLGFLGIPKLQSTKGILRGTALNGGYPIFYDSWDMSEGKKATHEIWVGMSGSGKTFYLLCYLARELAHNGVAWDYLEPLGHGKHIAAAFNVPAYTLSARSTCFNPHDVMFERMGEQLGHTLGLYETILGRSLSGSQEANIQKGLLAQALRKFWEPYGTDLTSITPDQSFLVEDVCDVLYTLGDKPQIQSIAQNLADEIAGLCCGSGPFAHAFNGLTTVDFSLQSAEGPRVFLYHELEDDPILIAIAYTQTLAALMRDSMKDDTPRIIAVDEVFRMMRHPSLMKFLVIATKTLRTRRKKLLMVDQQMSIFLEGDARLVFENCPIRVIFNQRGGMNVFHEDQAFEHLTTHHRKLIASLQRFQYILDIQGLGVHWLLNQPTIEELWQFGTT